MATPTPPDLAAVKEYLGIEADDNTRDASVSEALAAEAIQQRRAVRKSAFGAGTEYPADLALALKRRVARNLSLKGLPLAVLQGDAESGPMVLPGRDPEVRRLEGPYRRLVLG
jgi:hypothetical protein